MRPKNQYLLSLPERALRSASALAAGLVREIGNVTLPKAVRRTRLYQTMVETTLRFLIEQVGQVEGCYPAEGELAENFLLKGTLGDGIDLAGPDLAARLLDAGLSQQGGNRCLLFPQSQAAGFRCPLPIARLRA